MVLIPVIAEHCVASRWHWRIVILYGKLCAVLSWVEAMKYMHSGRGGPREMAAEVSGNTMRESDGEEEEEEEERG